MRKTRVLAGAAAVATALAAAGATWLVLGSAARPAPGVVVGHAADFLPNQSAQDWVTYADHVVVVTPVAEAEVPPTALELARGEGLIGRTLDLRVDSVVWSRRDAARPAPAQIGWQAFGWQFSDGDLANRAPLAAEDAPRLELGHQYVLAITWQPQRCSEGDVEPARWEALGADAIVPYDGGLIGQGEWQGRQRSVGQARSESRSAGPATPLEEQLVGQSAGALRSALASASPAAAGIERRAAAVC